MEREMFCFQCQEAAQNEGCTKIGVCGKTPHTANLQDLLIDVTKGLCEVLHDAREQGKTIDEHYADRVNRNLFITITNANFDNDRIQQAIHETLEIKKQVLDNCESTASLSKRARWYGKDQTEFTELINEIGVLTTEDEDMRSIKELILYGLKGIAAYHTHAHTLSMREQEIDLFMEQTLATLDHTTLTLDDLISLTMKTGEYGVRVMALLDEANTSRFGHPTITNVTIGVGKRPGILVSGHDLHDLEQLLEQSMNQGIDIYTHSEMLPAHYYPFFKNYPHFVGNYGNAWWKQKEEFISFQGPILLTTNCLVPPKESYKDRIYTTGTVGFQGCKHISGELGERKDFSELIEHAKRCEPPIEIETGTITGGFAHHQVLALANNIIAAIQQGDIKKFVVMAGCDGRSNSRTYYRDFAEQLPKDTVILTAGCAKYRYNKLDLGDIHGIPRVLDAGQCNDAYSLAMIALKLKEVFQLEDINDLPIIYNIAWYEQKAVIVLLSLLYLGVKDIRLGPTLPAFLSKNIVHFLVENFGITPIQTVDEDLVALFPEAQASQIIHAQMIIGDIIRLNENAASILEACGMGCIGCPASQSETLEEACLVHGLNSEQVLSMLNQ